MFSIKPQHTTINIQGPTKFVEATKLVSRNTVPTRKAIQKTSSVQWFYLQMSNEPFRVPASWKKGTQVV